MLSRGAGDPTSRLGRGRTVRSRIVVGARASVLSSQPLDTEPAVRSACEMLRGLNTPGGVATTFADGIAEMADDMRPRCSLMGSWRHSP